MSTLHILNGDSVADAFRETGLGGDILVCREGFSEGPLAGAEPGEDFWACRKHFISNSYGKYLPREEAPDYDRLVRDELERLEKAGQHDEVILWFEFDLFCQVNLLYCLSRLAVTISGATAVRLVCPADHPEIADFRGLGQLNARQLLDLLPAAQPLDRGQLSLARRLWQAYARGNTSALTPLMLEAATAMPLLGAAMAIHLNRVSPEATQPGTAGAIIRQVIRQDQPESMAALMRGFWRADRRFGYGDLQILHCLEQLQQPQVLLDGRPVDQLDPRKLLSFEGRISLSE